MKKMFHLHELEFYIRSPKYSVDQRALHTTVIYELKYPIQGVGRVSPSAHASDKMGTQYVLYFIDIHRTFYIYV